MEMIARPRWVMVASVILLLWNLAGLAAFFSQWTMAAEALATLPPAEQEMWHNMPGWAWAAYGIAVGTGTLGAVSLLLKKGWAVPLFGLCLIGVLVQFTYPFFIANGFETLGASAALFPALIVAISGLQFWRARKWRAAGWLA